MAMNEGRNREQSGSMERGSSRGGGTQKVRDIMTRNPECVMQQDDLQRVSKLMLQHDVGALPVVESRENRKVIGMITDRDIVVRVIAEGKDVTRATVSDAMSSGVATVSENDSMDRVFSVMSEKKVRRVPVVDEQNQLVGIVAQADVALESRDQEKVIDTVEEISEPKRGSTR